MGHYIPALSLRYKASLLGTVQRWVGSLSITVQGRLQARTPLCPQVVEKGGPYPLIILPQFGGYWIEDPENVGTPTSLGSSVYEEEEEDSLSPNTFGYKLECRGEARAYRRHFLGKVSPGTLLQWTLPRGWWHGTMPLGMVPGLLWLLCLFSFLVLCSALPAPVLLRVLGVTWSPCEE